MSIEVASACPICGEAGRKYSKGGKELYGEKVCKKCFYSLMNRRQIAYVLDAAVYSGVFLVVFIVLGFAFIAVLLSMGYEPTSFNDVETVYKLVATVALMMHSAAFTLKDFMGGRSVGKFLCGVQVIDEETGEEASFKQIFKRNAMVFLCLLLGLVFYRILNRFRVC